MCSPDDLPQFVYATTTHVDDIARYGKLVIEAAQSGDDVARDILARAGSELAECVLAIARKLHMTDDGVPGRVRRRRVPRRRAAAQPDAPAPAARRARRDAAYRRSAPPVEGAAMMAMPRRGSAARGRRTNRRAAAEKSESRTWTSRVAERLSEAHFESLLLREDAER